MTKKFREFCTQSGVVVLGGKDAESNEELIKQVRANEIVLHTREPGSPFCNIKADSKDVKKQDIKESAVFCARYSKDWKKNKKDVEIHIFDGKNIYKTKGMPLGTFGVRIFETIRIKKQDILEFEKKEEK